MQLRPAGIIVEVVDEVTGREVIFPSAFGPQGNQKKDCPSIIRSEQMDAIREAYKIPDDVEIRTPENDESVDWVVDGWTPMYTILLSMRLRFPIGGMLRKLCKRLWIAPSQVNPNTMRILLSFDEMAK